MNDTSRLIEYTFSLKQTSMDSVHEKNVRHGHISTLHIWPARRPMAACRAAMIAKLLPILICVKATIGDIEVSANEWSKACNLRQGDWLYAVYNCATPNPRLVRVQDPFDSLLAKAKVSILVSESQIVEVGEA